MAAPKSLRLVALSGLGTGAPSSSWTGPVIAAGVVVGFWGLGALLGRGRRR